MSIVVCCNDNNLTRKTGMEPIYDDKGKQLSSVLEFWQGAYSDIIGNIERGHLAEYLVARALDAAKATRGEWDFYILLTEKLNMEVKEQKTISLQKIIKLGAEKCSYSELSASINKLKCLWDI